MSIAVFGNTAQDSSAAAIAVAVRSLAASVSAPLFVEERFAAYLEQADGGSDFMRTAVVPDDCTMVVCFGGDGTFLQAVHWIGRRGVPVLGINTGHLGYLAAMPLPQNPGQLADFITRGEWHIEEREMLAVSVDGPAEFTPAFPYALNEVAFHNDTPATTLICAAALGSNHLATYTGDGLLVCTPTGSTAYNLSAGGPIVQPSLDVMVISPIASHTLALRPLVVSCDEHVVVTTRSRSGCFRLSLDGSSTQLPAGTTVRIKRAPFRTKIIRVADSHWLKPLREKLLWDAGSC